MNRRKIILLVEDEPLIALNETFVLEREGYTVIAAGDGLQAIEIMRSGEYPVDLVLMDIDLGPGIDGTEAAREILKRHDVPVVFLSSHTEKHIVDKTESITSFGYILKDAGDVVLLASVRMAFRLHEAYRNVEESDKLARASEQRYRDIFNSVVEGVFRTTAEGKFVYINPAGAAMLGYESPGKLMEQGGDISGHYINPQERNRLTELLAKHGCVERVEIEMRRCGGARIWVSLNATADYSASGGLAAITCTALDITEQKHTVEELKTAGERYRALSRASFEAILISENGVVLDANENASLMSGYPREEMIGMPVDSFTTCEIYHRLAQSFDASPDEPLEAIGVRKDGSMYLAELRTRPFMYRGRKVLATAVRDVTEREKMLTRNFLQSIELASARKRLESIVRELATVCDRSERTLGKPA